MSQPEDAFAKEIEDVALLVHAAEDRKDDREFLEKAHLGVQRLAEKYRALSQSLSGMEEMKLDRNFGRKVRDIQRLATLLPRLGHIASDNTPDRQVTGPSRPGERKITGVSWGAGTVAHSGAGKIEVGSDVEAWCGTCKDLVTHSIFAVMNGEPKKVTCTMCGARHNYRTAPARSKSSSDAEAGEVAPWSGGQRGQTEADRKRAELNELANELARVEDVIPFEPQRRYKAGEVISHPEFGRGKVETVLRASILVRFGRGGMKSIMLL